MPPTPPPEHGDSWVEIIEENEGYSFANGRFRVIEAKLRHRLGDGRMSDPITRINFNRGDSVGVLLYDPSENMVVMVKQFRYPVYAGLSDEERNGDGAKKAWILEVVAGVQEPGQTTIDSATRELLEESGYEITGALEEVTAMYPSPGGSSEKITLFIGEVDQSARVGEGGGVATEGEDIEVVAIPLQKAMDMIASGELQDAKAIILLQHLALNKDRKS